MNRYEQRTLQRKAVAWYNDTSVEEVSLHDAEHEHAFIHGHFNSVISNYAEELLPHSKSESERDKIVQRTARFLGGEAIGAIAKSEHVSAQSVHYTVRYALRRLGLRVEEA